MWRHGWVVMPVKVRRRNWVALWRVLVVLGRITERALCSGSASARHFMGFVGLTPSEYSTSDTTRRGRITKAGNAHLRAQLNEAAWAYSHVPHVGPGIAARQQGLPPEVIARSWKAQQRLCRRYRHLAERKSNKNIVITAVARELAGFVWAEMTID
jgi:transposase